MGALLPHGFHAHTVGAVTRVWADGSPRRATVSSVGEGRWELEGHTGTTDALGQSLMLTGSRVEVLVLAVAFCAPGTPMENHCWTVACAIERGF